MDLTWSEGLSNRMKKKGPNGSRSMTRSRGGAPQTLPQIRPNTHGGELRNSASAPELAGGQKATALQQGFNLRVAQFMDRQLNHSSIEARKAFSVLQRQIVTDGHAADDIEFWGNKGVQGFRSYLKSKFGSIVAGWRHLDEDKNGRLSFYEFCNACRQMGYHGNLKKLWRQLDDNGNGFVSLMEIDPEVGRSVGIFKLMLMKKYGDMLSAWKKGLDINNSGRIEETQVERCLAKLCETAPVDHEIHSLTGKKLYAMLRGPSLGMTLEDFDPDAYKRSITGDLKGYLSAPNKEFIEDLPGIDQEHDLFETARNGGARAFRRSLAVADAREVHEAHNEMDRFKLGLHTVDGFKSALINRCGSLLGAWREHLDLDGNSRLTFGEFTQALQRLGFHGDVKGLWRKLDMKGMGYLSFGDLDKDTDDALTEFRDKLCKEYGNMLLAWMKGLDTSGTNCVDERQFLRCCEKVGFSGDAGLLFQKMRPEAGRRFLTLKDFDTQAYNALHRGDFRMISESEHEMRESQKRPMDMTFHERQEAGFFYQIRKAWDAAKQAEFAKACRLANHPDHEIASGEAFQSLLMRKYGSIIGAWRNCLDSDHNGKLTFNEFCQAVRWLGYAGNLKTLWSSFDKDGKGYILLRDLDPEADDLVTSLLSLLNDRYGDLDSAWKYGFNKDPHDSIDEAELKEACEQLGYQHDVRKLMKCLVAMPGRQLITIWDLDPACSRARRQAKDHKSPRKDLSEKPTTYASAPKSPTSHPGHRPEFGEIPDEESKVLSDAGAYPSTDGSKAANDLKMLRLALRNKYGSTVAAWRAALDPEKAGCVPFGKFVIVLQECSFHGNVKTMWAELTSNRSTMTFSDLDPDAARMLDECRKFMLSEYGTILKAWHKLLDDQCTEIVDKEDFLNKMMGKVKTPEKLFRILLARHGQRSLIKEDLKSLLITLPKGKGVIAWSGYIEDFHPAPESDGDVPGYTWKKGKRGVGYYKDGTESATLQVNGSAANVQQGQSSPKKVSPRYAIDKVGLDFQNKDKQCTDLDTLKKLLTIKYGSLFAAWRKGLDVDQNGVVTQLDFAKACQKLGVKAIQTLWAEFDKNKDGQISLNELDPDCAKLFNFLEQLLISRHGTTKTGWQEVFDPKRSLRCDEHAFVKGCQSINFDGDGKTLFRMLRPEPGRPYLTYDDLWIDVNINGFQLQKPEPHGYTQGSPRSVRSPHSPQSSPVGRSPNASPKRIERLGF